jgi:transcriptional regulator with XRE-family HTH domain
MVKSRIKEWLAIKGVTGRELAAHLDVRESQVSNWVHGRSYPRFEKLWKMAKFLGCKMDDLYEEKE